MGESDSLPGARDSVDTEDMFAKASSAELRIDFDGPALVDHEIDVETLAPALLAFAKAIRAAQQEVDPEAKAPRIKIKATSEGSFIIDLVVEVESLYRQVRGLLNGDDVEAVLNAAELIGLVVGAAKLMRFRSSHPDATSREEGDVTVWEDESGESFEAPRVVVHLTQNNFFMGYMADASKPLEREGIDTMIIAAPALGTGVELKEGDESIFDSAAGPVQNVTRENVLVDVKGLKFDGGRWQLGDGERDFTAVMEDEAFIQDVETTHRRFAPKDMLKVRLRTEQYQTPSGQLRSRRYVEKVLEHRPYMEPPTLFD